MSQSVRLRRNRVFKSLHKPLTYMGVDRRIFFVVAVASVAAFNLFDSLLAGLLIFAGGSISGYWVTNADAAFLAILFRSGRFKARYDAGKQQVYNLEIR